MQNVQISRLVFNSVLLLLVDWIEFEIGRLYNCTILRN